MQCCHLACIAIKTLTPPYTPAHALLQFNVYFSLMCLAVFTCENSVWHHISLPLRENLQRSDDGSLLVDRLQGCAEWKLQVILFKTATGGHTSTLHTTQGFE